MNRYETVTIFDADTAEDERKAILERVETLIAGQKGTLFEFDNWGGRKLAYPIRKKKQGFYVRIDYCGGGELVSAIERMLLHDLRVLRFMTVRLDIDVDPDALKAEMAQTEKEPVTETAAAAESKPAETETAEAAPETDAEATESEEE